MIDFLINELTANKNDRSHKSHDCKLKPLRILLHNLDDIETKYSRLYPDADFEKGVIKILRGDAHLLMEDEILVCNHLKRMSGEESLQSGQENDLKEGNNAYNVSIIDAYY